MNFSIHSIIETVASFLMTLSSITYEEAIEMAKWITAAPMAILATAFVGAVIFGLRALIIKIIDSYRLTFLFSKNSESSRYYLVLTKAYTSGTSGVPGGAMPIPRKMAVEIIGKKRIRRGLVALKKDHDTIPYIQL